VRAQKEQPVSVRETINQNRRVTAIAIVGILLLTSGLVLWQTRSEGPAGSAKKAFFTVDDGKTWFADDIHKLSPFDHNGKIAYRCYVYSTEDGKTRFVSHLERYSDDAKKVKQQLDGGAKSLDPISMQALMNGTEVKRPGTGDTGWISTRDPRSSETMSPRYPADPQRKVVPVEP
jgi:hypothetical protein